MKPRILVIVDVAGWALDRTADNIMEQRQDYYRFEKAFNHNSYEMIGRWNNDILYATYWRQFADGRF